MNEKSCAPTCRAENWDSIDWNKARAYVKKLQMRMEKIRFPHLHRLQRQVQKRRAADEILTFTGIPPIYTRGIRKPQMPLVTYQSAIYSVSVFI